MLITLYANLIIFILYSDLIHILLFRSKEKQTPLHPKLKNEYITNNKRKKII